MDLTRIVEEDPSDDEVDCQGTTSVDASPAGVTVGHAELCDALLRVCRGDAIPAPLSFIGEGLLDEPDIPVSVKIVEKMLAMGATVSCRDEKARAASLCVFRVKPDSDVDMHLHPSVFSFFY